MLPSRALHESGIRNVLHKEGCGWIHGWMKNVGDLSYPSRSRIILGNHTLDLRCTAMRLDEAEPQQDGREQN